MAGVLRADRPGVEPRGVRHRFSGRDDGDLCVELAPAELDVPRRRLAPYPWSWLRQVHGAEVVLVERPGGASGAEADALVTAVPGAVLAVHTADCAGVVLSGRGPSGPVVAAAHAGWRGLLAGVLQRTVEAMQRMGVDHPTWRMGPCISPDHYEFGEEDLARLVERFGERVRGRTRDGRPALDLRAGVAAALAEVGAVPLDAAPPCTSEPRYFSWRCRRDRGRQAALVWIEPS